MTFLTLESGHTTTLASNSAGPEAVHVFDTETIQAVNAAIAAQRPLLVRGEPGIGKSQMARAVAKELRRAYIQQVVDARTESRDLLWHFDAVKRLAEAQVSGSLHDDLVSARASLIVDNFLHPRALWWAFNWTDAAEQAIAVKCSEPPQWDNGDHANGCLVLIDEIDKGESDVPNGLLEALGTSAFTPEGRTTPVSATGTAPIVIITTNEERTLPDAFIRRCLVLHLALPKLPEKRTNLINTLVERGAAHFRDLELSVRTLAAEILCNDRQDAQDDQRSPLPGQAEYLDMLRAVRSLHPGKADAQKEALNQVAAFVVRKHGGAD